MKLYKAPWMIRIAVHLCFLLALSSLSNVGPASAACATRTVTFHNTQGSSTDFTSPQTQTNCISTTTPKTATPLKTISTLGWSRAHYDFIGWATSAQNSNLKNVTYGDGAGFIFQSSLATGSPGTSLYATWVDTKHQLIYHPLDASGGVPTQLFGAETPAYVSDGTDGDISKPGYTLIGWQDGLGNPFSFGQPVTLNNDTNLDLYPIWSQNLYFSYDANGGSGTLEQTPFTLELSAAVHDPAGFITRDGYTFVCWNTASNGSCSPSDPNSYFPGDQLNQSVTLYAIWAQNYSIRLHKNTPNGADTYQAQTTGGSQQLESLSSLTYSIPGYDFIGWSEDPNSTTATYLDGAVAPFDGSISDLYAVWQGKTVRVTFNPGTADSGSSSYQDIVVPNSLTLPANPYQKSGYVFTHWNTNSGGTGTSYDSGAVIHPTSNLNLYPSWNQFSGPSQPSVLGVTLQTSSGYVFTVSHADTSGFTTLYYSDTSTVSISQALGATVDTVTVTGLTPNSGVPINVRYTSGANSVTYGVSGSDVLHAALGPALDPSFDPATATTGNSMSFSITDKNYDPLWSYNVTVSDSGSSAIYSGGVLSLTGLSTSTSIPISVTVTASRTNYYSGHNSYQILATPPPTFSAPTRNISGYSFSISNFENGNSYSATQDLDNSALTTNGSGHFYVTGLSPTLTPVTVTSNVNVVKPSTSDIGYTRSAASITSSQLSQSITAPFSTGSKILVSPKADGLYSPKITFSGPTYLLACVTAQGRNTLNYALDAGTLDSPNTGFSGSASSFPANLSGLSAAHILNDDAAGATLAVYGPTAQVIRSLNTDGIGLFVHNLKSSLINRWQSGDALLYNFVVVGRDDIDPSQSENGFHGTVSDCGSAAPQNSLLLNFSVLGLRKSTLGTQHSLPLHR